MARKADIQYIQHYYTSGTAARKLAVKPEQEKAPLPFFEPQMLEPDQKISVAVDPLSLSAIVVAAVLVVLMVVSLFQYGQAYQRQVALQEYVYTLSNENAELQKTYESGYDLAEIEAQAIALGMIPVEEAQVIQVSGTVPAVPAEPTRWESIQLFLSELFA